MHRKGYSHAREPNFVSKRKPQRKGQKVGPISWILVGVATGLLAKWVAPDSVPGSFIVVVFIGVSGASLGGFLAGMIVGVGVTGVNAWSILVATLGAIALLFAYELVARRAA
jgi:uncharacterized membrane protein YeaQ/YmgE (transglycosylase-associated protein family)